MVTQCVRDTVLSARNTMVVPSPYGFAQFARQCISNDICDDWDGVVQLAGSFSSLSSTRCMGIANVVCIFRVGVVHLVLGYDSKQNGMVDCDGGIITQSSTCMGRLLRSGEIPLCRQYWICVVNVCNIRFLSTESNVSSRAYGDVDGINWDNSLGQGRDLG